MKKAQRFKELLQSKEVVLLMEAHNGLSAKIVEEAGFDGIWASGLTISAAMGVRDNNEASWTQVLEMVEFMSDATQIPLMVDADTGYGNFNNVRRLVRKLEQRHVAAMCIEDKLFPKTNSFIASEQQPLADIGEFAGKIKAAKDTQDDPNFCVVARVEAFIAGWGLQEALRRAEAYYNAGADGILIHSKMSKSAEVMSFMKEWGDTCPVVIVPTMYYSTPIEDYINAGISMVIWANHLLRGSLTAMQQLAAKIARERSVAMVEDEIAPVQEIFRLQNAAELKSAEKRYLPEGLGGPLAHEKSDIPAWQRMIRNRCRHPSGIFVEFVIEDIEQSIPARFELQVRNFPQRLAIKTDKEELTYEALNKLANRIASAIIARLGETGDKPVALLFEQGYQAVAAILGALKAGKVFVPLDADFPLERNKLIVNDCQAALVLTNNPNVPVAQTLLANTSQIVNLDGLAPDQTEENPNLPISPDAPAYIMYTSGATGQPKGVIQNHRNVLHKAMAFTNSIHICPDDRMVLLYSHSTSGATRDIFSILLTGAALFPFNIKRRTLDELVQWLLDQEITIYNSVATVFRYFADSIKNMKKSFSLRAVNLGSETIYARDVELYKKYLPADCIFVARLGSTEISPIREYFVDKNTVIASETVPAGYSVAGAQVHLLDDEGNDVGINNVGEIAVKSRYLPVGYWNESGIVEVTDTPCSDGPQERLYRTGDIGLMQADGCLIHLGRKDFQVKVRGYRIEVAEIETALTAHSAIKEAAVVFGKDGRGEQQLIAYVVPEVASAFPVSSLRDTLSKILPDHMIPSSFVTVDALPLTPVGKIDRKALVTGKGEWGTRIVDASGYRIELQEIESVLQSHADIQEAIVLARENSSGDKQLTAYVVTPAGRSINSAELREFLRSLLPEFKVPSVFVPLDTFPLTITGEVDRRALPAPETCSLELMPQYEPPASPTECQLAEIWCSLLAKERVGRHDDIFDLGGHSLTLTRLAAHIENSFGVSVPLLLLFEHRTIEQMALVILEEMLDKEK